MALPIAFNDKTGEIFTPDANGNWVKRSVAKNDQTGEKWYSDDKGDWQPLPLTDAEYGAGAAASVLQGPLLGFGDEAYAAVTNPISATRAAIGAEPETGDYYKELKRFRENETRFRQLNPWTSLGLTAAGGIVGGGVPLARAAYQGVRAVAPQAGRLAQSAIVGAGFGGLAGAGSGEGGIEDRAKSAGVGATIGAGLGAGLEALAPLAASAYRLLAGRPQFVLDGRLTAQGTAQLRMAGYTPAQIAEISDDFANQFGAMARQSLDPAQSAATAEARSLPVPVALRQGQVTLNPEQQMFESQSVKGLYGDLARERIASSEAAQQQALRENVGRIAQRIGGGQVQEFGQGVTRAQETLAARERAAKEGVNAAYDAVRAGGNASIEQSAYTSGVQDILAAVSSDFETATIPKVSSVLANLVRPMTFEGGAQPLVSTVFSVRRMLSGLGAEGGVEGAAATRAKRALDNWITNTLDELHLSGDKASIQRWRNAIRSRAEYGSRFNQGNLVERLVERAYTNGRSQLKVDPAQAASLIFGRSNVGWIGKPKMASDLLALRRELADNPQAWNALREEAFLRLAYEGEGAMSPSGREFSGARFAKLWQDATVKYPEVINTLFTPEERSLIGQFARVANRVTTPVKGGANFSNTSAGLANIVRRMMAAAFMGPKAAAIFESLPFVRGVANIGYEMKANAALRPRLDRTPTVPLPPLGVSPTISQSAVQQRR